MRCLQSELQGWLGHIPGLGLIAEHGFYVWPAAAHRTAQGGTDERYSSAQEEDTDRETDFATDMCNVQEHRQKHLAQLHAASHNGTHHDHKQHERR